MYTLKYNPEPGTIFGADFYCFPSKNMGGNDDVGRISSRPFPKAQRSAFAHVAHIERIERIAHIARIAHTTLSPVSRKTAEKIVRPRVYVLSCVLYGTPALIVR